MFSKKVTGNRVKKQLEDTQDSHQRVPKSNERNQSSGAKQSQIIRIAEMCVLTQHEEM